MDQSTEVRPRSLCKSREEKGEGPCPCCCSSTKSRVERVEASGESDQKEDGDSMMQVDADANTNADAALLGEEGGGGSGEGVWRLGKRTPHPIATHPIARKKREKEGQQESRKKSEVVPADRRNYAVDITVTSSDIFSIARFALVLIMPTMSEAA
ncbi:hypothetical protein MRB53_020510 [Persea americana]|uniref:Uncharacterized protein n=1 Tax=Persea americana TaxID=3435 RepID=A0ACC2L1R9_PERAE|nr:hypothetical protein MRB53_020510 [Persea americana]